MSKKIFLFVIGVILNAYLFFGACLLVQSINYEVSWVLFLIVHFFLALLGGLLTDEPRLGSMVGMIATVIINYGVEGIHTSYLISGLFGGVIGGFIGKHYSSRKLRYLNIISRIVMYGFPSLLITSGFLFIQYVSWYPVGFGVMSLGFLLILMAKVFSFI